MLQLVHITAEDSPGASFKNQQMPLLEYITELMPGKPSKEAKRRAAQLLLELMGFQVDCCVGQAAAEECVLCRCLTRAVGRPSALWRSTCGTG